MILTTLQKTRNWSQKMRNKLDKHGKCVATSRWKSHIWSDTKYFQNLLKENLKFTIRNSKTQARKLKRLVYLLNISRKKAWSICVNSVSGFLHCDDLLPTSEETDRISTRQETHNRQVDIPRRQDCQHVLPEPPGRQATEEGRGGELPQDLSPRGHQKGHRADFQSHSVPEELCQPVDGQVRLLLLHLITSFFSIN